MALINCPICNKQISDKAKACPHCGASLSGNNGEKTNRKCEECGMDLPDNVSSCPSCGCPVNRTETPSGNTPTDDNAESVSKMKQKENSQIDKNLSQEKSDTPSKKGKTTGIIIGIVAVLAIAGIAVFMGTAKSRAYSSATKLYKAEKYKEAKEKYLDAKDYKDAKEKVTDCDYQMSTDGKFLRELSKGLMERWDQSDKDGEADSTSEEGNFYANYCDIELSHVEEFEKASFDNSALQKDATTYIELLRKAKESTKYATIDTNKFYTDWGNVYSKRTQLLKKIIDDYGLTVDKKHEDTLKDLMRDAGAAAKVDAAKEEIAAMVKKFKISITKDEYGFKEYKIHMKNTTAYTFDYFSVDFNLLDKKGNIVDTGNSSEVTNWNPGQKADVDAYCSNNSDPSKYTISYTPHYSTVDGTIYD